MSRERKQLYIFVLYTVLLGITLSPFNGVAFSDDQISWGLRSVPALAFFPLGGNLRFDDNPLSTYIGGFSLDSRNLFSAGDYSATLNTSAYFLGLNVRKILQGKDSKAKVFNLAYVRVGPYFPLIKGFGFQFGYGAVLWGDTGEGRSKIQHGLDLSFTFTWYETRSQEQFDVTELPENRLQLKDDFTKLFSEESPLPREFRKTPPGTKISALRLLFPDGRLTSGSFSVDLHSGLFRYVTLYHDGAGADPQVRSLAFWFRDDVAKTKARQQMMLAFGDYPYTSRVQGLVLEWEDVHGFRITVDDYDVSIKRRWRP